MTIPKNIAADLAAHAAALEKELAQVRAALKALQVPDVRKVSREIVQGKRKMSAAGRAAISRAAKKRWAAWRKAQ